MNIKELLQKREELSYELIDATSSREIRQLTDEIMEIENEIELATGKSIEEVENDYRTA